MSRVQEPARRTRDSTPSRRKLSAGGEVSYDFNEGQGDRDEMEHRARLAIKTLADNECSHGSLPTDGEIRCKCFCNCKTPLASPETGEETDSL